MTGDSFQDTSKEKRCRFIFFKQRLSNLLGKTRRNFTGYWSVPMCPWIFKTAIINAIRHQEQEDKRLEQMNLWR